MMATEPFRVYPQVGSDWSSRFEVALGWVISNGVRNGAAMEAGRSRMSSGNGARRDSCGSRIACQRSDAGDPKRKEEDKAGLSEIGPR